MPLRNVATILVLVSSLTLTQVFGEPVASPTPQPSSDSANGNSLSQITPPPPVNPSSQDRKNNSGAAGAAAAAGAAIAGAMCAVLMREAMKEKDPEKKMMTMMMAMQQCNQAAQSAQAANQNKDSKEKLSQNDSPKGQTLPQSPPMKAPEKPQESQLPEALKSDDSPFDVGPELAMGPEKPNSKPQGEGDGSKKSGFFAESTSQLKVIENPNLSFEEGSKGGGVTPSGNAPIALPTSKATGMTADEIKALIDERTTSNATKAAARRMADEAAEGVATSGSSSGSSSGGDPKDFDSLLASLMGGPAQGEGGSSGGVDDVLAFGPLASNSKSTIFRYASYRYQKAAVEDKRLAATRRRSVTSEVAP